MNNKDLIRDFEVASGLEIFGLGARREMWDDALKKFAELIVRECADYANWYQANSQYTDIAKAIKEHFGVEE